MPDMVGNPDCGYSHKKAQLVMHLVVNVEKHVFSCLSTYDVKADLDILIRYTFKLFPKT